MHKIREHTFGDFTILELVLGDRVVADLSYKELSEDEWFVGFVHVKKRFRGLGFGTLLMKTLIRRARHDAVATVTLDDCLDNSESDFYTRLGFTADHDGSGNGMTLYLRYDK